MRLLKTDCNKTWLFPFLVMIMLLPLIGMGQTDYFLNQSSTASTGSEIKITEKGDTILVSTYGGENLQNNTQQRREIKYLGTPYYGNRWYQGQARLKGGEPSKGVMAFNVVKGVLHFSVAGSSLPAIEVKPERFALDDLVFHSFEDVYEGASNYYYNVLVDGEPKLLKQYHGQYVQTKDAIDNSYGDATTQEYEGKFMKEEDYYFVIQKQLILVKKRKAFIRSLGPYEKKAARIIKQEGLNLKKPSDIITLAKKLQQ